MDRIGTIMKKVVDKPKGAVYHLLNKSYDEEGLDPFASQRAGGC